MPNGANSVHKQLRTELENYIKSQYFGKSPLLLSALSNHIDDEGLLYQRPFIESSPAYVTVQNGIETAALENWMKDYFLQLAKANIGVFPLRLPTKSRRLKLQPEEKTYLFRQVLVPVKPSVLCGHFLQRWRLKQETLRNHGQNEVFAQLLCTQ